MVNVQVGTGVQVNVAEGPDVVVKTSSGSSVALGTEVTVAVSVVSIASVGVQVGGITGEGEIFSPGKEDSEAGTSFWSTAVLCPESCAGRQPVTIIRINN